MIEGTFYSLHSEWETRRPEDAAYAKALEAGREQRGLPPSRSFPCQGAIREVDRIGSRLVLACDDCGFVTTADRPTAAQTGNDW